MHPATVQCSACLELCRSDAVTYTRNIRTISYCQGCKRVTQVYRDLPPLPVGKVSTHGDRRTALVKGTRVKKQIPSVHCGFSQQEPSSVEIPSPSYLAGCWDAMGSKCTAQPPGHFAKPAQSSVQRHNRDKPEVRVTESLRFQRCGS